MEHSLKHNVSITIDQKLFREIENIRGREKRSTFIEHLIQTGLKNYKTNSQNIKAPYTMPNQKIQESQTEA
jgi:metal-responsive CopG/Arc/MetJ family transcriptional regulator